MHPDESGFLAALRTDPSDDTARLAYADWLEDRNDPRAELLRLAAGGRGAPPARQATARDL